jgi:hypothetical protein
LRQFAAAAGEFDATGSRDAGEFAAFMSDYTVRDTESAAVVRVMTVHKSKGLGFDVVVLPELEGKKLDMRRDGLAVQRAADRSVEWVLDLPGRVFCEHDPVLAPQLAAGEAEAGYENLSLLYVAMTRAKRAMFVLTKPPGDSTSRNFPRALAETLGEEAGEIQVGVLRLAGAWSSGEAEWFRTIAPPAVVARGREEMSAVVVAPVVRHVARRPSGEKGGVVEASRLFVIERGGGVEFGRGVHACLAEVEWGGAEAERIAAGWRERGAAGEEALASLRAPGLVRVWTRPDGNAEVWRERAFEIVLAGDWVTGVFDRVVVESDANGRVRRAVVFDFKTDRVSDETSIEAAVARHAGQLNLYRGVAALLTGLPPGAVECVLAFTKVRRCVSVSVE